jgi:hypothetical protein
MGDPDKWASPLNPYTPQEVAEPTQVATPMPAPTAAPPPAMPPTAAPAPEPAPAPAAAQAPEPLPTPEPDPVSAPPSLDESPMFEHGGEKQTTSDNIHAISSGKQTSKDNALVVDEKGKSLFKMNVDRERVTYDPGSTKLKVEPLNRINQDDLLEKEQTKEQQIQDQAHKIASTQNVQPPKQAQRSPPPPDRSQWQKMMREVNNGSSDIYKTASVQRAMGRSRFIELGDAAKGGHYADGASNMKGKMMSKQSRSWSAQ